MHKLHVVLSVCPTDICGSFTLVYCFSIKVQNCASPPQIKSIELEEYVGFQSKQNFRAPPKQPEELTICTQYFYYFEYDGKVTAIHVSNGIPVLCVNLVRSFLNMLYFTVEKQTTYDLQEVCLHIFPSPPPPR